MMTVLKLRTRLFTLLILLGSVFSAACGGSEGDDEDGADEGSKSSDGTVTELWAGYCTATFTEDYEVIDVFGDPDFTAKAGETYLVNSYDSVFGEEATLYFLTSVGPDTFEVAPESGSYPFTSDCEAESTSAYNAVFTDVTVYATEDLETVLCELPAGLAVPNSGSSGYAAYDFNLSGPTTYEIFLGGLSSECGGAENGYVSVPETTVRGTTTWLVPIQTILGPAE